MGQLEGKRAVVTGAGSGIGRASALRFAQEGAMVLVVDRAVDAVRETAARIEAAGGRAIAMAADAGDEADVMAVVARAVDQFGGLDVMFANAGIIGGDGSLFDQSVELWQEVLRVNLIGPFLAVKHAGRHMIEQGSCASVCTAAVAALRANAGGSPNRAHATKVHTAITITAGTK